MASRARGPARQTLCAGLAIRAGTAGLAVALVMSARPAVAAGTTGASRAPEATSTRW